MSQPWGSPYGQAGFADIFASGEGGWLNMIVVGILVIFVLIFCAVIWWLVGFFVLLGLVFIVLGGFSVIFRHGVVTRAALALMVIGLFCIAIHYATDLSFYVDFREIPGLREVTQFFHPEQF